MVAGNVDGMAGGSNHLQQGRSNKGMVVVPWGGGRGKGVIKHLKKKVEESKIEYKYKSIN